MDQWMGGCRVRRTSDVVEVLLFYAALPDSDGHIMHSTAGIAWPVDSILLEQSKTTLILV